MRIGPEKAEPNKDYWKNVSVRLNPYVHKAANEVARLEGYGNISNLLRALLNEYLDKRK